MLRKFVERVSRGLVLKRQLPQRLGSQPVLVSPDIGLKFWRRDLDAVDRPLFALAEEFVGRDAVVWDVGASVGLFSLAASYLAGSGGQVVAIEPDGWSADLLCRSLAMAPSGRAPVSVVVVAVSAALGVAEFCVAARGRASSSLAAVGGLSQSGGRRQSLSVVTVTLDWLLDHLPSPSLLKIDVEGAEDACLIGASRLLASVRPDVLCEISEKSDGTAAEVLLNHDYVLFNGSLPPEQRIALERPVWSTLARPRERVKLA
jgi:FkbM family methyltransferase